MKTRSSMLTRASEYMQSWDVAKQWGKKLSVYAQLVNKWSCKTYIGKLKPSAVLYTISNVLIELGQGQVACYIQLFLTSIARNWEIPSSLTFNEECFQPLFLSILHITHSNYVDSRWEGWISVFNPRHPKSQAYLSEPNPSAWELTNSTSVELSAKA